MHAKLVEPTVDPIVGSMDDEFGDFEPMGYGKDEGRGVGSKTVKDGASQKAVESTVEEGKPKPAEPFAQAPRSAAPPLTMDEVMRRYRGDEIWDASGRARDTEAGRVWTAAQEILAQQY
jgi:hypothetical protein